MAALEPIKLEIHNAQFLGDVIAGMTPIPRDLAAIRRCTECLVEVHAPAQALEGVIKCPNCGRATLDKKFRVRVTTGSRTNFMPIFDANPYIDQFDGEPDISLHLGTALGCKRSNTSGEHITQAFHKAMKVKTGWDIPHGELIPDLHLSEAEKNMPPLVEGRYWVICIGKRPPFTSKFWPPERWQEVVNAFPEMTFVQIGHSDHEQPELVGENVINMVGRTQDERTGLRDFFRLVYYADGCCSLVSSLMHIAAGFRKPCVIPAGAREPITFEQYSFHRYLANQGSMECVGKDSEDNDRNHTGIKSCWKSSADACPNLEDGYPKCLMMIEAHEVVKAIQSYYTGGHLKPVTEKATVSHAKRPTFKLICNAHAWGGGERSAAWIANRMLQEGYDVHVAPTGNVNDNFQKYLSPYIRVKDGEDPVIAPCDLLAVYTNDMTYGFKDKYAVLEETQAERKVMILNYRLGDAGKLDWTTTWDKYIFLCSDMEREFRERVPECDTSILPPPVDLKPFLDANFGSLNRTLQIVRVGSQSSQKIPPDIRLIVERIKGVHSSASFTFMGGHPTLDDLDYVDCIKEYSMDVMDVLRKGTVFWYILPEGYLDNGPRVIMEAMAAGLPVVCDNRGGAADRVTNETGWLCDTVDDHIKVFEEVDGRTLNLKGQAAKERAREFDPDKWIEAIKL